MNVFRRISLNLSNTVSPLRRTSVLFSPATRYVGAYEGHGKTNITILNKKDAEFPMIVAYSQIGFRLHNNAFVVGPMILCQNTVLSWNVRDDCAINEDTLEFFYHLVPPVDLLIIGISDKKNLRKINKNFIENVRKRKISLEILVSNKAIQMYNFTVGTRNVAAALMPPKEYELLSADIHDTNVMHGAMYEREDEDTEREYFLEQFKKMGVK